MYTCVTHTLACPEGQAASTLAGCEWPRDELTKTSRAKESCCCSVLRLVWPGISVAILNRWADPENYAQVSRPTAETMLLARDTALLC
jgi:hypothetical protein